MRVDNKQLKGFLLDSELLDLKEIEDIFDLAEKEKRPMGELLLEKKLVSKEELDKLYAYILGTPFVDISKETIPPEILKIIPEPIAKKYKIVAFDKSDSTLKVAMLNPDDLQTIEFIKKKTGLSVTPCLTTEEGISNILKQYEKSLKAEFGDMIGLEGDGENLTKGAIAEKIDKSSDKKLSKEAEDLPVIRVVDTLIKHAILESASDIHIEPDEKEVRVRYRIDGILHDAMTLPRKIMSGIIARIKVLANLKLDEHRLPQDGRFKIINDEYKISFRVNILPIFDGEKVVMRLLDETSKGLTLEKMGLQGEALEIVHREVTKPNGMILVTGPTGSGKTTTLYTIMDILNTPTVNISTVEDPVEYRMPRVNQTQINSKIGLTFAASLRALLRQDPDIIMVGEIRDEETMEIAMHAAMTGHLVLSTLHTNSAAGTLPRLLDMGAEPFLVASTTNVVIAQRLVRKLCNECKTEYNLEKKEVETLEKNFDTKKMLEMLSKVDHLKDKVDAKKGWEAIKFYKPKGCKRCNDEGYKGRMGIYEVLEINSEIEKLITQAASAETIEKKASEMGVLTMIEDGFIRAAEGTTSIEEILRVTKE
ncbi:MAG: ATPase, T2SS/T4P/T4SS family [Parcubacteria group bacterium]|jgi:type IV pilus assembly protein PilB